MIGDLWGRPLNAVRLSVTDRCNLRCQYCMPEADYAWLPKSSLLSYEELTRLARVFAALGVTKLRITGGEPLLRRDLSGLVAQLHELPGISDIALTTNGVLLESQAGGLRNAGLGRVTVSLDTLRPDRMREFARSNQHHMVLRGIEAARATFGIVKLNTVVVRGFNDDEIADLAAFAFERGIEPRFIEYMDVGGATRWSSGAVVSRDEILSAMSHRFGPVSASRRADPHAPAEAFTTSDGRSFGVIASTTTPFCSACDRARVTADGTLFLCLYADDGIDLRTPLRAGATDADLSALITRAWQGRSDRGAELRRSGEDRMPLVALERLRADPRQEMHVRGG